jgi:hypothetical protein
MGDVECLAAELSADLGLPVEELSQDARVAIERGIVKTLGAFREILVNGPMIEGFEHTSDVPLSHKGIRAFLLSTFGLPALRRAKIGKILKIDDTFFMEHGTNYLFTEAVRMAWGPSMMVPLLPGALYRFRDPERYLQIEKAAELLRLGVVRCDWNIPEQRDEFFGVHGELYTDVLAFLASLQEYPYEVQHLFKVRAYAGEQGSFAQITLGNFSTEQPEQFDYLTDLPLSGIEKMRAYILGTIAHECFHRLEHGLPSEALESYATIVREEQGPRGIPVTDYVRQHRDVFWSSPESILSEDLVESGRLYVTNSGFLQTNYPCRYHYIRDRFPFVQEGTGIDAARYAALEA